MEFEKLKEIIADVLGCNPDTITPDTTFVDDLGADSLDIFQIIMGIEDTFDIEIELSVTQLSRLRTQLIRHNKGKARNRAFSFRRG